LMGDDTEYRTMKKEWRALIFAYRYRNMGVRYQEEELWGLNWDTGRYEVMRLRTIKWVFKEGVEKIGKENWEHFMGWVNKARGEEVFEVMDKYWDEANRWFPNEGY
jgi:hypothetical protein